MKQLFPLVFLAMTASACAQQQAQPSEPSLRQQIVQAEQRLERLSLTYTEFHPIMVVAERAIWDLESRLPAEERAARLGARLVAEQRHFDELIARGVSEEDSAARRSSDRLRYLEELLATRAN